MNVNEVISDTHIFSQHYILRNGFEFKPLTYPYNVYDALVIKSPPDAKCLYPRILFTGHSLSEQMEIVNRYKIEKAIIVAEDISFLMNCPTLKYLEVIPPNGIGNNFDFSPLYEIPELKSLCCRTMYGIGEKNTSQVDYSKIKGIESLSISGKGHLNYNKVETLRTFGISGYTDVDLVSLFSSKVLDTLLMITCKIRSLEGIQQSDNIQCLYLYHNRLLQDISALKKVKRTIRALRIENCPNIYDFSVLGELENLELLELSGNNALPNLNFLGQMKKLKTFILGMNVKDGDLTPCMDLSYVYLRKNRKHFNLKDVDLPKNQYIHGNENIEIWRRLE